MQDFLWKFVLSSIRLNISTTIFTITSMQIVPTQPTRDVYKVTDSMKIEPGLESLLVITTNQR